VTITDRTPDSFFNKPSSFSLPDSDSAAGLKFSNFVGTEGSPRTPDGQNSNLGPGMGNLNFAHQGP
jgi:hypothetical protein